MQTGRAIWTARAVEGLSPRPGLGAGTTLPLSFDLSLLLLVLPPRTQAYISLLLFTEAFL